MATDSSGVVIVGGGITGVAIAYYLGKAGVKATVIEKDSVGSHASGFAYGGLSPLSGAGIPGPMADAAQETMRLHLELARSLPQETGVSIEFRQRPTLTLALNDDEAQRLQAALVWQQQQPGYHVEWLDAAAAKAVEPRITDATVGAVHIKGGGDVEPYRMTLALTRAAENMGATVRHGRVIGLTWSGSRVAGVKLESGELACDCVVLAMGPWSAEAGAWLNLPIEVRPLKGQIIRLRAPGAPLECSVGWKGNYATTKPDGLLWTGTTEEEAGFDEHPTQAARDQIIESLLTMLPSLSDAELVEHTACLRPLAADEGLLVGRAPNCEGVYLATGAGRKGILFAPVMARATADLIVKGEASMALDAFDPGRFAR